MMAFWQPSNAYKDATLVGCHGERARRTRPSSVQRVNGRVSHLHGTVHLLFNPISIGYVLDIDINLTLFELEHRSRTRKPSSIPIFPSRRWCSERLTTRIPKWSLWASQRPPHFPRTHVHCHVQILLASFRAIFNPEYGLECELYPLPPWPAPTPTFWVIRSRR